MTMDDEAGDANVARILSRLMANGWERTAASEALRWAYLVYDSPVTELEVDYMPEDSDLAFRFLGDDGEYELVIEFDDQLDELLDLITQVQDTLSPETWDAFVDRLVTQFPRVSALVGDEDGDDEVVVLTPEDQAE